MKLHYVQGIRGVTAATSFVPRQRLQSRSTPTIIPAVYLNDRQSLLDVLAEAAAKIEADEADVPPRHQSVSSLEDLNQVLSYFQAHPKQGESCLNCTAPLHKDQMVCSYCGHEVTSEAEILGESEPWLVGESLSPSPSGFEGISMMASNKRSPECQVALAVDDRMMLHRTTLPPYPERPERLQAIVARLCSSGLAQRCNLVPAREATDEELLAVHSPDLVNALSRARPSQEEGPSLSRRSLFDLVQVLDPAMLVGDYTDYVARLAAGSATDVALAVANGQAANGVAIIRPPGHHASRDHAEGGCYFNNVAVAARAVQSRSASKKILIVDWDVHFGHGTQKIFDGDDSVLYVSMHRQDSEFYPATYPGDVNIVGSGVGSGYSLNLAFVEEEEEEDKAGSGGISDGDFLSSFFHVILPLSYSFSPDLILVSAGFTAVDGDFIGGCSVSPACYGHMTHLLKGIAPVVLVLEGGYNLDQTARCMEACVSVLLGEQPPALPPQQLISSPMGRVAIMNALQVHSDSWPSLKALSWSGWMEVIQQQQQKSTETEGEQEQEETSELELEQ